MSEIRKIRKNLYDGRSAGALYSAAAVLPVLLSFAFAFILIVAGIAPVEGAAYPDWYVYCTFLLPQFAFAFSVVLFFVLTDARPKEVYRGAKWQYFVLACLVQFGLFSLSWLNEWFLGFLGNFGYAGGGIALPSLEGGGIVGAIVVIALLPAIFEESIFRGILLRPMKGFSTPVAVVLCGALFSLYHGNPAQTIYQFLCGCAFALIAIRADSVLPTMLSHFLNNAVILILTRLEVESFSALFYVLSALALVGSLVWLVFFDRASNTKKTESMRPFLVTASVGMVVCAVLWIANLVEGFL